VTLGNAVKLIRTARGVKQLTLAKELGISPNYLSLLEKDKREPSISFLRKLAKQLGVPAGLFLLWQDTDDLAMNRRDAEELRELLTRIQVMSLRNLANEDDDAA
jgi:XRE family transcriptional regulator, regulator of sulfur utilization